MKKLIIIILFLSATSFYVVQTGEQTVPAPVEGAEIEQVSGEIKPKKEDERTIFDIFRDGEIPEFEKYKELPRELQELILQKMVQSDPQINPFINSRTFRGGSYGFLSVAYSPDGKHLASGSGDHIIRIWDLVTEAVQTLQGHTVAVNSVAYSPNGEHLASGSYDGIIKIWDLATAMPQTLQGHTRTVSLVAYSPDGEHLASGSYDGIIKIWDLATGAARTLRGLHRVNSIAYSPDGKYLAFGLHDKTIKILDLVTGRVVQTLQGHPSIVTSVAYSPDGKYLASGSTDGTMANNGIIKIWDSATWKVVQTLQGLVNTIESIAYSPDGKHLASGSFASKIKIWDQPDLTPEQAAFLLLLYSYQDKIPASGIALKIIARTVGLPEEELPTIFRSFSPTVQQEIKTRYRLSI